MTPTAPIATIETDAFCERCGFNLRTQPVWRDERLAIPVCRCPECGRHAAAGRSTTAATAWLRRLALAGLVGWLFAQIAFTLPLVIGIVGVQAMASDGLMSTGYMTRDGRPVIARNDVSSLLSPVQFAYDEVDAPFDLAARDVVYGKRLAPWLTTRPAAATGDDARYATPAQAAFVAFFAGAAWLTASAVLASLSWFWRRGAMWLWLGLPVAGTLLVVALIEHSEPRAGTPFNNGVMHAAPTIELGVAAGVCGLFVITMAIGLAVGRSLARIVISIFIPPRARQLFAFLWHCDGKTMLPVTAGTAPSPASTATGPRSPAARNRRPSPPR